MNHRIADYPRVRGALSAFAACAFALTFSSGVSAQERFKTPQDAVTALVAAVRSEKPAAIVTVFGRDGRAIAESGDPAADAAARAAFITAYDARNNLVAEAKDRMILTIGADEWPFPIPLVMRNDAWQFDTAAGRTELLYRRIGRNELNTIQVVLAYVDAQNEYAAMNPEKSPTPTYARQFFSSPGKKDGLYWPAAANEPPSPLGDVFARATSEGYRFGGTGRTPYHGYYFKILTAQGPTAAGGAVNYVVKDRMIGGFALVAWPASYGNSGVMTFLVSHAGTIFQKDLGSATDRIISQTTTFNPDQTWKRVSEAEIAGTRK
jgi:hypothetical protein